MKNETRIFWILAGLAIVAATLAFVTRSEMASAIALAFALIPAMGWMLRRVSRSDPAVEFLKRHPIMVAVGGWAFALVGLAVSMAIGFQHPAWMSVGSAVGIACVFIGIFIAMITKAAPTYRADEAERRRLAALPRSTLGFDGVKAAADAGRALFAQPKAFLMTIGLWTLITGGLVVAIAFVANQDGRSLWILLLVLLFVLTGLYIGPAAILVSWSRHTIAQFAPVAGPGGTIKTTAAVAWRLLAFSTVLGGAVRLVEDALGSAAERQWMGLSVAGVVTWTLLLGGLMLSSSFGLRLSAIAVGDKDFTPTQALIQGRRMWPDLPLGMLVAVAPWLIVSLAVSKVTERIRPQPSDAGLKHLLDPASLTSFAINEGLLFAATACAAGFLARAYVEAKMQLAMA